MDLLLELARKQLENQFLTGGAVLVVFTGLLALLRNVPRHLWAWALRNFVTTVDIADHDPAFYWVQQWLGKQPYTEKRARLLTASTRTRPVNQQTRDIEEPRERKRNITEVVFSPAPGHHLIRFQGHYILLTRVRREGDSVMGEVAYHESMVFQTFSREVIRDLIFAARDIAFPPADNRIAILRANYNGWRVVQRRPPRSCDSVVLYGDTLSEIRQDLVSFFESKQWYTDHGIPYQRGYLLLGPPGSGKTSTVIALASLFDRDIHIISLSMLSDNQLVQLISELPEHALVLVEDVDCLFNQRERKAEVSDKVSFSGFINAIDGVSAPPGRVLFMTTNHVENLDAALLRPGRVDRRFEFKDADSDMAQRLFLRFFPGMGTLAQQFGDQVQGNGLSMAVLQEHLLLNRNSAVAAANLIKDGRRGGEEAAAT